MLAICLVCLFLGYLIYGRFIERMVIPFRAPTPAVDHPDGMDYVPMSKAKNHLIQLLNIAGTGGTLLSCKHTEYPMILG